MSHPVPASRMETLSSRRVLGLVAMFVAFLVVQACGQADSPRTRIDQVSKARRQRIENRRWQLAMRDDSAFKVAFSGLSASETQAKIKDLIRRGDRRLSEKDQIRKVALLGAMLNAAPEEECVHDDWWEKAMLGLDSAGMEEYMALSFAAIQAEIRGASPTLRTDSAAVVWALHTLISFSPDERRVFANRRAPRAKADHCRLARALYGRILALPESQKADYARAVITIETSRYEERMRRLKEGKRFVSP
jgi:hypothetical protein